MAFQLQHILTMISSFIFHLAIFKWLAAPLMKKLSPDFKILTHSKQIEITNSVMALVHGAIVGGTSAYIFMYPGKVLPSVFWYDSSLVRHLICVYLGYTVADTLALTTHSPLFDRMMVVHHLLGVFGGLAGCVDPILPYFNNLVLLVEVSNPFVNMRTILHALGQKNSRLYKLNGVVMLVAFFACRIATIPLWFQLSQHMATGQLYTARLSLLITIFFCVPLASAFNIYWFGKMCKGAYRVLYHG